MQRWVQQLVLYKKCEAENGQTVQFSGRHFFWKDWPSLTISDLIIKYALLTSFHSHSCCFNSLQPIVIQINQGAN